MKIEPKLFGVAQCCQNIFLRNHDFWAKKSRKSRAKKPKIAEKSRVFTPKFLIIWPSLPILLHFYALIFFSKLNFFIIFKKKFERKIFSLKNKKFLKKFWSDFLSENFRYFFDKNANFLSKNRGFSRFLGKFSKIADF